MKTKWLYVGLGSFIIVFLMVLTLVFPAYDPKAHIFVMTSKENMVAPVGGLGDPRYGVINTRLGAYEWDAQEGRLQGRGTCRINDTEFYVTVACGDAGSDNDGFARSFRCYDDNGTVRKQTLSKYEYDITNGEYANILHIPGTNKYLVAYRDTSFVTVITLKVWENGTINKGIIDSIVLARPGYNVYLSHVNNKIYAVCYREISSVDGFLETVWVNDSGTINNSICDYEEFDEQYGDLPSMCLLDSDTIALAYNNGSAAGNYTIKTYNISHGGIITDTPADYYHFESNPDASTNNIPLMDKIHENVYALTYTNSTQDILCKTVAVADTGMITHSIIDTLFVLNTTAAYYPLTFIIHDASIAVNHEGIIGVAFRGVDDDGFLYTWNVSANGSMDNRIIDFLEYDDVGQSQRANLIWTNHSNYFIMYSGDGFDGWATSVNITTNWDVPDFSSPQPVNNSVGVHLQPWCNITIGDWNADTMTISWFSNYSDGVTWVHQQTNVSCSNGTYKWHFTNANSDLTKYWWKVYVNDTLHNVSSWYCFTTEEGGAPERIWHVINDSNNGDIFNVSSWYEVPTAIGGTIYNLSEWTIVNDTIDGDIFNISKFIVINSSNSGDIYNSTSWVVINSSVSGDIYNSTSWVVINYSISGDIYNATTTWKVVNDTVSGDIFNVSEFFVIDSSISGDIYNSTSFVVINSSLNGSIYNTSIAESAFNVNLRMCNPNPANGTHQIEATGFGVGGNYIKNDATGLTTSIDVTYLNFTTPPANIPGDYSLEFDSTTFSNGPTIENDSAVYATAWANTNGQPVPGNLGVGQYELAGDYMIMRGYLKFDTSSLPDEAVIDSGYVSLVVWFDGSDTDFNVTLQNVKPPAPHSPLITTDYNKGNFPPLATYANRNITGHPADSWFNLSLNTSALNDISLTGNTNMIARSDQDIVASAPGVGVDEWVIFYGPGSGVAAYSPHLIVNYTIPSSNWQHYVNLTWYSNTSGAWQQYAKSYVSSNGTVTVPAVNFSNVSVYWWNISWNSNHTNYGNSSLYTFETVSLGGGAGGGIISSPVAIAVPMVFIGCALGLLFARRRKRMNNNENG